ncbi:MAG: DNA polymerase III subunit gamma/tau [Oscillospiraceae bacterium]|jgi:DNA polymerase-3 subunit gamma/tau|nr:DNA polymerase III subunit gamma/tau [Oscillospiraceae bacterium]
MYLALYRKYRSKTFSDVISQPHITTTLQNQVKSGQVAHAYLFTGSRGTGKTTCAKILAKAVNCLSPKDGSPCLECESCLLADGSTDISEIDAASNNSVDDVRALRDEAVYLPTELKYKVYIIDEAHMLSASAFNALLKTLEEPPQHVIFILATTESHKIPATVLSRCQRFEFNRINAEESALLLTEVAEKEGLTLEKDAALLISGLSDGGMRDALSLLDVAASEGGVITREVVRDCAGIAGKEHLFAVTDAIANGDGKSALEVVSALYSRSKDPSRLVDELIRHFRNLMIIKLMPDDCSLLTALPEELPDYKKQAGLFSLGETIRCLEDLEDCLRLRGRRVEAEICLMKMCLSKGEPVRETPAPPVVPRAKAPPETFAAPAAFAASAASETPLPFPPPKPSAFPEPAPQAAHFVTGEKFGEWERVLEKLDAYRASMLEEADARLSGRTVVITGNPVLEYFFDNEENAAALTAAVREVTGSDLRVVFERGEARVPNISRRDRFFGECENAGVKVNIL